MKIKAALYFLVGLLTLTGVVAQDTKATIEKDTTQSKEIELDTSIVNSYEGIHADKRLLDLLHMYKAENKEKGGIDGFRVQIHFGTDYTLSTKVQKKFEEKYPKTPIYLKYESPNFRLRVGDFRNRFEATGFLEKISEDFPNAFRVRDVIQLPVLTTDCDDFQKEPLKE